MEKNFSREMLLKQLDQLIPKLSLKEISKDFLKKVPELSWTSILQTVAKKQIRLSRKTVSEVIIAFIQKSKNYSKDDLLDMIASTDILYVAKYSQRKQWHAFMLESKNNSMFPKVDRIVQDISDVLLQQHINNQVHYYPFNGIIWIRIFTFKTVKKRMQMSKNYLAIIPSENYMFTVQKTLSHLEEEALKMALNVRSIKGRALNGRAVQSLIDMLKNKENRTHNVESAEHDILMADDMHSYTKTDCGYNFVKATFRQEYATKVIGDNPPVLQTLTLRTKRGVTLGGSDEKFDVQLKISSPNVLKCLQTMMEKQIISTTAPSWYSDLPHSAKNVISVKNNTS